jgi:hypothetical protein
MGNVVGAPGQSTGITEGKIYFLLLPYHFYDE